MLAVRYLTVYLYHSPPRLYLNRMIPLLGLLVPQTANMLCGLAIGDSVNSSVTNKDLVLQSLSSMFKLHPNIIDA